jgi:hypothetical protein
MMTECVEWPADESDGIVICRHTQTRVDRPTDVVAYGTSDTSNSPTIYHPGLVRKDTETIRVKR